MAQLASTDVYGRLHVTGPVVASDNLLVTGTVTIDDNTVWHAGNDGSGSGLDADLLDGKHASAFSTTSHSHSDYATVSALSSHASGTGADHTYINQSVATGASPSFSGLTVNTGDVVIPDGKVKLCRSKSVSAGGHGISWYSDSYYTWYDYMSNPTAGAAPSGATPPAGTLVTSWARRFNVESASGYGWIFESNTNASGAAPSVKFEIRSSDGAWRSAGGGTVNGTLNATTLQQGGVGVCLTNDSRLSDARTPTAHAVNASTYGYGDATNAGHLRVGTGLSVSSGTVSANFGTAAGTICQGNDSRLSDARTPTSHAVNASTYGYGDTTNAGHLRVGTGLNVASGTVSVAYGTTTSTACAGNDARLSNARTPLVHGNDKHSATYITASDGDARYIQQSGDTLTGYLTLHADPTSDMHPATKRYVDAMAQGLQPKEACRLATTASITLSGVQTIDGVAGSAGDRVLVKDQSTASENGIYVMSSSTWARAADANSSAKVAPGTYVWVTEGSISADTGWVLTTDAPITLGTTALTFEQFTGAGQVIAGYGLSKSGNTLSVNSGQVWTFADITPDEFYTANGGVISGQVIVQGAAASRPIVTRGISGSDGSSAGNTSNLYLNYDSDQPVVMGADKITIDPTGPSIITGSVPLKLATIYGDLQIGPSNSTYCHYSTDRSSHWFNTDVRVQGEIYAGSSYNQKVWHQGNDGSGSGLDADLLDGKHATAFALSTHSHSAADLPAASTSAKGVVQLSTSTSSTSTTLAATASAVKAAYDKGNHAHPYAATSHAHVAADITDFSHSHVAADLPSASTSVKGVVQLSTSTASTSTTLAATASAVKAAYDKGNHTHPYAATTHSHTAESLPSASTSAKGVVQLSTSTSSTSTTLAATPSAVKAAYDRANEVRTLNATFVLESRTSDPASPMTGQMWLRTDLT